MSKSECMRHTAAAVKALAGAEREAQCSTQARAIELIYLALLDLADLIESGDLNKTADLCAAMAWAADRGDGQ